MAFVATTTLLFAVVNAIKLPAYISAGRFDWDLQRRLAWAALLIPIGVAIGRVLITRINPKVFNRIIVVLMAAAGVYLLIR